jgi:hypothetical protein
MKRKYEYYVPDDETGIGGYTTTCFIAAVVVSIFKGFKPIKKYKPLPPKSEVCKGIKYGISSYRWYSPLFCSNCPWYSRCSDSACGY